jgi:hypothetical protein
MLISLVGVIIGFGGIIMFIKTRPKSSTGSITGIVTSKFTDCVGGNEYSVDGKIIPIEPISCDGGSTITIDRKETFVTESGYVAENERYSVDVSSINVGDKVRVKYALEKGHKSLHCQDCSVSLISSRPKTGFN